MEDIMKQIREEYDIVYQDPVGLYKINDIIGLIPGISINVFNENGDLNLNSFDENGYCLPSAIRYFLIPKPGVEGNLLICALPLANNERNENNSWFYITQYLGFGLIKRPNPEEFQMIDDWAEETMESYGKPTRYLNLYGSIKNKSQPTIRMITIRSEDSDEEEINA